MHCHLRVTNKTLTLKDKFQLRSQRDSIYLTPRIRSPVEPSQGLHKTATLHTQHNTRLDLCSVSMVE